MIQWGTPLTVDEAREEECSCGCREHYATKAEAMASEILDNPREAPSEGAWRAARTLRKFAARLRDGTL